MKLKTLFATLILATAATGTAFAEDMPMTGMNPAGAMAEAQPIPMPDAAFLAEHGTRLGDLVLYNAFTRAMPPTARAGGGFVTIANTGTADDRLVSAASPAAKVVQLHTMTMDNNVMVMRELEYGVEIPAGSVVALKPGGMHIMFIDALEPFKQDGTVAVTLQFEKAGEITLELPVGALGSTEMPAMN